VATVTLRSMLCVLITMHATASPRVELHPERYSASVPISNDGCFCSGSKQLFLDFPFRE
jgi:hypothetical protein